MNSEHRRPWIRQCLTNGSRPLWAIHHGRLAKAVCAGSVCLLFFVSGFAANSPAAEPLDTAFEQHIRPVLAGTCIACHGPEKQEGGLRVDSREALLRGGDSGPAVVPGAPEESLLVSAIRYDDLEMPPQEPLTRPQVQNFTDWVAAGAAWPKDLPTIRAERNQIRPEDRQWWAFQPLQHTSLPASPFPQHARNEIDHFVHQRLAEKQLRPARSAAPANLVRRLYQTVIGLPPTPEQVDAFLLDPSDDAYESLVDELLSDQRYGEHWARFWLDLVRYAESDGWKADAFRPHAWRYRDYVIHAFNSDKAFPEFVREQLAGDEQENPTPESLAATGFLRLGIFEYNQRNARQHWNDILNEITDVTGDAFLGIGMACARCHDHKFDPVLQVDYFKLRAFFEPLVFRDDLVYATAGDQANYQEQQHRWKEAAKDILDKVRAIEDRYNQAKLQKTVAKFPLDIQASYFKPDSERNSFDQQMHYLISRQFHEEGASPLSSMKSADKKSHEALLEQLKQFEELKPPSLPKLMAVANHDGAFAETVIPGSDAPVPPGFLRVLSDDEADEYPHVQNSPRTALANWISSPDNPLPVRVIVNRIWKQHFGQGLVRSVSDFGTLGGKPSHPELLDWLAQQFIADGWHWKRLHKRILMSATWRQAADHDLAEDYQQVDPQNRLLWRGEVRRLTAEQIRDAMLYASGELATKQGGPSVPGNKPRRSIYVKNIRNTPNRFLAAFDSANGLKSLGQRNSTTTPTQALMMVNGDFVLARAKQMAVRLNKLPDDDTQRAATAIRWTWNRDPSSDELARAAQFVRARTTEEKETNLIDFCHLLLNSNEFLYVD